jgi:hypothetical protein
MAKQEPSAEDMFKEIRKETARRKAIWDKMQAIAKDALKAAQRHAKQRGITKLEDWFGFDGVDHNEVSIQFYMQNTGLELVSLKRSGELRSYISGDKKVYGYPDLTEKDLAAFQKATVETLISRINLCLSRQEVERKDK